MMSNKAVTKSPPSQHQQIKEIFIAVVDLPKDQQKAEVVRLSDGDTELAADVLTLLEHHRSDTILGTPQKETWRNSFARTCSDWRKIWGPVARVLSDSKKRLWIGFLASQIAMLGATWLATRCSSWRHLQVAYGQLEATLRSQTSSISNVLDVHIQSAKQLDSNSAVREAVFQLENSYRKNPEDLNSTHFGVGMVCAVVPSYFNKNVQPNDTLQSTASFSGHLIAFNRDGVILVCSQMDQIGKKIAPTTLSFAAPAFEQQVTTIPPKIPTESSRQLGVEADKSYYWVFVPINDGQVVAGVGLPMEALADQIRQASDASSMIDCYLFNPSGLALSPVRHESLLRDHGILPRDVHETSDFKLVLRDPGVDLSSIKDFSLDRWQSQPLTFAVRTAIAGEAMFYSDNYRDYRGANVIGVSKFMNEYQLGLVAEIDSKSWFQASEPWKYLLWAQMVGLAVSLLAGGFSWRQDAKRAKQASLNSVGDYQKIRLLGSGGMGSVFLCFHPRLRTLVAVKTVDSIGGNGSKRILLEAQAMASLSSPHVAQILDLGTTVDGTPFIVMQYVKGVTLDQLTRNNPLDENRALNIWAQLLVAVEEAHALDLLHRDIKPQNVIVGARGGLEDFATLLDFGISKSVGPSNLDISKITAENFLLGTPKYLPPERLLQPSSIDARTDIYGLGVVLYRMLAGRDPIEASPDTNLFEEIMKTVPPDPSLYRQTPISNDTLEILKRCLAKDPSDRPASVQEIAGLIKTIRGIHMKNNSVDASPSVGPMQP